MDVQKKLTVVIIKRLHDILAVMKRIMPLIYKSFIDSNNYLHQAIGECEPLFLTASDTP